MPDALAAAATSTERAGARNTDLARRGPGNQNRCGDFGTEFAWGQVPAFLLSVFAGSVVTAWLFNSSGQSVFLTMVLHATVNAIGAGYSIECPPRESTPRRRSYFHAGRLLCHSKPTGDRSMKHLDIRQRDKSALREGYSPAVRRFEIASIFAYALAMSWLALRLAPQVRAKPFLALSAFMFGFVAADFGSGFVHWMADTWGTPEWPVIGKALIRPFREHHVDQKEITRHDFVETNGNNCFISIAPTVGAALLPAHGAGWFFVAAAMFSMSFAIFGTNQFHKWAHMDEPPRAARVLQRAGLILPPEHHEVHHTAPYAKYYCITVGWLNEALFRLRFFPMLERLVTALTGLLPREDDIGKHAALAVAQAPLPPLPDLTGVTRGPAPAKPD